MLRKLNHVMFIIFSVLLVLNSGTIWQLRSNVLNILFYLTLVVIIILNLHSLKTKKVIYLYILIVTEIVYLFIYPSNLFLFIVWGLILLTALISVQLQKVSVIKYVYMFILFLSSVNLIIYILILGGLLNPTEYMYLNDLDRLTGKLYTNYYNLFYNWQLPQKIGPLSIIRNSSIFVEAGRYGVFLNIALLYLIYYRKNYRSIELIVIILNTIFTLSTTSIVIALGILASKLFVFQKKTILYYLKFIIGLVITALFIIIGGIIIVDKISGSGSHSYESRIYDMQLAWSAFKNKPIFGYGVGNDLALSYSSFNAGNSNGLTKLLYQGGIFIATIFIFFFVKAIQSLVRRKGIFIAILTVVIILLQIASQSMIYDPIILYFLFFIPMLNSKIKGNV